MRRFIVFLVLGGVLSQGSFANSPEMVRKMPIGGLSLMLHGSFAVIGVGGELFLGNLGLGGQFTFLPLGGSDGFLLFYEPGANLRFYPFGPLNSLYVGLGLSYFRVYGEINSISFTIDPELFNYNLALGYSVAFGDQKNTRLTLEIGPRFVKLPTTSFFFPHFNLSLGNVFY